VFQIPEYVFIVFNAGFGLLRAAPFRIVSDRPTLVIEVLALVSSISYKAQLTVASSHIELSNFNENFSCYIK